MPTPPLRHLRMVRTLDDASRRFLAQDMIMVKVLIVHPDLRRLGGIESYFRKLFPHLHVPYESFPIAKRPGETGLPGRVSRILADYLRYWGKLSDPAIAIVHLNPSLEPGMFYRESVFLLMAKLRRKKTVVFIRGWNSRLQQSIDRSHGRLFRLLYGTADEFIVLASSFARSLREWKISQPVHVEVTIVDDESVEQFDLEAALAARLDAPRWQLLFSSRLMRAKGITTTIRALQIVQQTYPEMGLLVAGDGELAGEARALAQDLGVRHVQFLGAVGGTDRDELYRSAHVLCLPTEHGEGFPNTVVEAMAFGLPVVTRPVGGIADFFRPGIHGFLCDSTEPRELARLIIRVAEDRGLYRQMAMANHAYARSHFLASRAAARLERIYASLAGSVTQRPPDRAAS